MKRLSPSRSFAAVVIVTALVFTGACSSSNDSNDTGNDAVATTTTHPVRTDASTPESLWPADIPIMPAFDDVDYSFNTVREFDDGHLALVVSAETDADWDDIETYYDAALTGWEREPFTGPTTVVETDIREATYTYGRGDNETFMVFLRNHAGDGVVVDTTQVSLYYSNPHWGDR